MLAGLVLTRAVLIATLATLGLAATRAVLARAVLVATLAALRLVLTRAVAERPTLATLGLAATRAVAEGTGAAATATHGGLGQIGHRNSVCGHLLILRPSIFFTQLRF